MDVLSIMKNAHKKRSQNGAAGTKREHELGTIRGNDHAFHFYYVFPDVSTCILIGSCHVQSKPNDCLISDGVCHDGRDTVQPNYLLAQLR